MVRQDSTVRPAGSSRRRTPALNNDVAAREVAREQEYVDTVYAQLEKAALSAQELAQEGLARGRIGNEGGLVERDAMVFQAARRMATLDAAHEGLVFGRLDLRHEVSEHPALHRPHRAARRQLRRAADRLACPCGGGVLPGDAGRPAGRRSAAGSCAARACTCSVSRTTCSTPRPRPSLPIVGEGALLAQLTRARDRSMHSIVATIQAEQDRAIRAPNKGVVSISGGPGHRQDRRGAAPRGVPPLRRPASLRDRRRPRGRARRACSCATSSGCCRRSARPRSRCARSARSSTASARPAATSRRSRRSRARSAMAELLRRTARQAVPDAPREFRVFYRDDVIHLGPRELGLDPAPAALDGPPQPVDHQGRLDPDRRDVAPGHAASAARERTKEDFAAEMRTDDEFLEFAAAWWPVLDAATVLGWLRDPDLLARVSEGVLDDESVRLLVEVVGQTQLLRRRHRAARRAALPARRPADREHRLGRRRVPRRRGRLAARGVHRLRPGVRRPAGLDAADQPGRGRRVRARARRRGPGPDADAVADGRPSRSRGHLDDRRRPGPVVVAGAGRVGRAPARPRSATSRGTTSTSRRTTATPRRSTTSRPSYAAAGGPGRRPARRGALDRGRAGGAARRRPRVGGARARWPSSPARWRARSAWSCRSRASAR